MNDFQKIDQIKKTKKGVCEKMSMYRSYLLKQDFYAKKGNEKNPNSEKIFIKHDENIGGIYAFIRTGEKKGVKIITKGEEYFFNNFDKLDQFFNRLNKRQDDFMKIIRRKDISKKLRMLEI
ncbi:MAG: hypothetical protein ACTSQJ_06825 [Promethearchaeota archaeon]